MNLPCLVIAGTHSGIGKPTVTLAILEALKARGPQERSPLASGDRSKTGTARGAVGCFHPRRAGHRGRGSGCAGAVSAWHDVHCLCARCLSRGARRVLGSFSEGAISPCDVGGGRPNLRDELTKIGAEVEAVAAYRYVHRMSGLPLSPVDLVVLPSFSAARTVLSGDFGKVLLGLPMAAIGPQTEEAARRCGAQSVVRAEGDSVASLSPSLSRW